MTPVLKTMLTYIASYIMVLLIGYLLIQFLSSGFFSKFLKVKASRGKKVLVNVRTMTDHYFVAGWIEESFLVYKDRQKELRRIQAKHPQIYRAIGVNCINVSEDTNSVISPEGQEVSGFDAIKFENLYKRALMRPQIKDRKDQILMIVLVVLFLVLLAFIAYKTVRIEKQILILAEQVAKLGQTAVIQ
jgi:hypothetical protein